MCLILTSPHCAVMSHVPPVVVLALFPVGWLAKGHRIARNASAGESRDFTLLDGRNLG